ncbi:helicase [Bifidobacterium sp. UTCIF-39]|uniref:helicase n=1 Tax=Bifidobacterium sp. UTCIF-39 TaxID=1465359 RepID=UPI00112C1FEF|nr:helicase [Bifidobacterium sp. UTCIF-39]TPF97921.1 helicase [Bifidobacterium sp. UTCIF-39]
MNATNKLEPTAALERIRSWYREYRNEHGPSPVEDLSQLEARLDLTHAHPSGIAQLFASGHVQLSSLFRDSGMLRAGQRRLSRVLEDQIAVESASGNAQLSLAVGVASWKGSAMPLLLYPVQVDQEEGAESLAHAQIRFTSTATLNPAFISAMHDQGVMLDEDALLDSSQYADNSPETSALFSRITSLVGDTVESFIVEREIILGCFIHSSTLFIEEAQTLIRRMERGVTGNDLLDTLAGNDKAAAFLSEYPVSSYTPYDIDPHNELEIGDVDNVTRYAAQIVSSGASAFVDLPGGRGSESIAAGVTSRAIMNGKTVLYVPCVPSQKRRFVKQVKRHEMSGMLLDINDNAFNNAIDHQLIAAVGFQPGTASSHFDQVADELVGVRTRLARYLGDLHGKNKEWGISAYETIQNLARISALPTHPATHVRLTEGAARQLGNSMDAWSKKLMRAGELGEFEIGPEDTSWFKAAVYSEQEAVNAYQRVVRLLEKLLPAVREQIRMVVETCGFPIPNTMQEWGRQVVVLKNLRRVLDVFQPAVFERDIPAMIEASKSKAARKAEGTTMGFWERRRHVKEAKSLLRVGAQVEDLHEALLVVAKQAEQWRTFVPHGGWPVLPPKLDDIIDTQDAIISDLTALNSVLATTPDGAELESVQFAALESRLQALFDDHRSLDTLPERSALERDFVANGLGDLVDDLRNRRVSKDAAPGELQLAWWTTIFELIVHSSPIISNQDGSVLSSASERFAQVDAEHVASVGPMINQEMTRRLSELLFSRSHEANQLHTLLANPARVPLNRLRRDYPNILTATKPILVASPATLVANTSLGHLADIAIVDSAAHMNPLELLSILARVDQVVIIAHRETITSPAVAALVPCLKQLKVLSRTDRRDPRISQFLEENGYGKVPLTLSMPDPRGGVGYTHVEASGVPSPITGLVESSKNEIDKVVELVIGRATGFRIVPASYSLTIVTISQVHRQRIGAELKSRSSKDPGLRKFLRHVRIVSLNEVSGVESDDVIITFGFARTTHGRLLQQFGMLELNGGDAMLLDALALAHVHVDVVSSFGSQDLDDERLRQAGPQLMKKLLAWCEHIDEVKVPEPGPLPKESSTLLIDLAERMRARGLNVELNYGFPDGMSIPMVVGLPGKPFILAIETDDAGFMSIPSTRQRHRFEMEDLQAMGWSVMVVWSVAAFVNPDKEVDRVAARMAELVGASGNGKPGARTAR